MPSDIPQTLRPFFQEYELGKLDVERSAFTIIERALAWGDCAELRWLFARYGNQRLADWVRHAGWRCLPRRRFQFWVCYFQLDDYQSGERVWAN